MANEILVCENISKRYRIRPTVGTGWHRNRRVLVDDIAQFTKVLRGKKRDENFVSFWALKDVSFTAQTGDVIGVIGSNGAGKSTLLKILSRVTEPTSGRAVITGRVGSLLEVGTGFHSELTGRENIFISGSIIGMSRAEIKKKFDEIVAFSGVEKFLDTPVKRFSSGMEVRLAFSVAVHLNPQLLLVDEVLSVGDASFQQKSMSKIQEVSRNGGVILFVSHNMTTVASLCNKAIVLERGNVTYELGGTAGAIEHYLNAAKQNQLSRKSGGEYHGKTSRVTINQFDVQDGNGFGVQQLVSGLPARFVIDYEISPSLSLDDVGFVVLVKTLNGEVIANLSSPKGRSNSGVQSHKGKVGCLINNFPLSPGTISMTLLVEHKGDVLDVIEDIFVCEVLRNGQPEERGFQHHKGWVEIDNEWQAFSS